MKNKTKLSFIIFWALTTIAYIILSCYASSVGDFIFYIVLSSAFAGLTVLNLMQFIEERKDGMSLVEKDCENKSEPKEPKHFGLDKKSYFQDALSSANKKFENNKSISVNKHWKHKGIAIQTRISVASCNIELNKVETISIKTETYYPIGFDEKECPRVGYVSTTEIIPFSDMNEYLEIENKKVVEAIDKYLENNKYSDFEFETIFRAQMKELGFKS